MDPLLKSNTTALLNPIKNSIKPNLLSFLRHEAKSQLPKLKPFSIKQMNGHIYKHGMFDFQSMTNLSKDNRKYLDLNYSLALPKEVLQDLSNDGTRKWLLDFDETSKKKRVETGFIPDPHQKKGITN